MGRCKVRPAQSEAGEVDTWTLGQRETWPGMECADPCANNASGSGVGGGNGNGYWVLVLDLTDEMGSSICKVKMSEMEKVAAQLRCSRDAMQCDAMRCDEMRCSWRISFFPFFFFVG